MVNAGNLFVPVIYIGKNVFLPQANSGSNARFFSVFLLVLIVFHLLNCSSGESLLKVGEIPGYEQSEKEHIIFVHFKIKGQNPSKNEKVTFIKATSGAGRMKNLAAPVHYPYQIKAVPRYSNDHFEAGVILEHPLFRSAEVAGQDGQLSKAILTEKEGTLVFRFQQDRYMERVELYSITPERGEVKIYTLNLKQ